MRFYVERLGCPKNDTDAEGMSQLLVEAGYAQASDPDEADIIIVNTCGFIEEAKDESLQFLREYARNKRGRQILIAAGCFSERYGDRLAGEMPEIDGIIGTQRWAEIPNLLGEILHGERPRYVGRGATVASVHRATRAPSAYVKIADGCSVGCAFCAIPKIKGPHRSKAPEQVVAEVRQLADAGVVEVILIAQNTAAYGHEWGQRDGLATLLVQIVERVPHLPWIRLMYTYPEHITDGLVQVIADHPQIVKYLDIPLQHAHPSVLSRMKRPVLDARPLIRRLRQAIPGIALRSAFIVGYPGEDEKEFRVLLSFLEEAELDRVGVFQYSAEEGTLAASLPDLVSSRIKTRRQRRAMRALRDISARLNQAIIGTEIEVLIEGTTEQEMEGSYQEATAFSAVGRSYRDAPEVDGLVFVKQRAPVGSLVRARIIGAGDYDLFAELS